MSLLQPNMIYIYCIKISVQSINQSYVLHVTGDQPGADLGPLISPEAKQRVCDLVQSGVDEGASVSGQYTNNFYHTVR